MHKDELIDLSTTDINKNEDEIAFDKLAESGRKLLQENFGEQAEDKLNAMGRILRNRLFNK